MQDVINIIHRVSIANYNAYEVALWRLDTACGYIALPGHIQQLSSSIHFVSSHLDEMKLLLQMLLCAQPAT